MQDDPDYDRLEEEDAVKVATEAAKRVDNGDIPDDSEVWWRGKVLWKKEVVVFRHRQLSGSHLQIVRQFCGSRQAVRKSSGNSLNHLFLRLISTLQALDGLKFQALEGLKFQNKQTSKQMTQPIKLLFCFSTLKSVHITAILTVLGKTVLGLVWIELKEEIVQRNVLYHT